MAGSPKALHRGSTNRAVGVVRPGIIPAAMELAVLLSFTNKWDASHIPECRFVAVHDGKVVGLTALSKVSNRCVYGGVAEVSLYIAEDYRGKGVGRELLQHLIIESEKADFWMLQSGIMEDNTASISLHEKCGFRQVGFSAGICPGSIFFYHPRGVRCLKYNAAYRISGAEYGLER